MKNKDKIKKPIKQNPYSPKAREVLIDQLSYVDFDTDSAKVKFTVTHINELEEPIKEFGMSQTKFYDINNQTKVDKKGVTIEPTEEMEEGKDYFGEFDYWTADVKKLGFEGSLLALIGKLDLINQFD
jgi:hypothetical protein